MQQDAAGDRRERKPRRKKCTGKDGCAEQAYDTRSFTDEIPSEVSVPSNDGCVSICPSLWRADIDAARACEPIDNVRVNVWPLPASYKIECSNGRSSCNTRRSKGKRDERTRCDCLSQANAPDRSVADIRVEPTQAAVGKRAMPLWRIVDVAQARAAASPPPAGDNPGARLSIEAISPRNQRHDQCQILCRYGDASTLCLATTNQRCACDRWNEGEADSRQNPGQSRRRHRECRRGEGQSRSPMIVPKGG